MSLVSKGSSNAVASGGSSPGRRGSGGGQTGGGGEKVRSGVDDSVGSSGGARVVKQQGDKVEDITTGMTSLSVTGRGVGGGDVLATLSSVEKETVMDLKVLQSEYKGHNDEYQKELCVLKAKYEKLYKPLYDKRADRLLSVGPPETGPTGTPALPKFWLKCFQNSNTLGEMIESNDEPILAYLQDISSEWVNAAEQHLGFKLIFKFGENSFMDNNTIVKQYNMSIPEGDSQAVLNNTESTTIDWKQGQNPTKETVQRKQRNKRTKQTRTVTEDIDKESFFNFFCSHELPSEEDLEKMADQQVSDLELMIEADYEMGLMIRDKIIPQAVSWFLGEVVEEDEDFEDDDDEFDGADSDDDQDDYDDDEEDEAYVPNTQRRKR
eukprot:GHVS01094046.1.p1 GENE.GHVS01094046.1~~GHVS01094046.1.p1  ORF type:complete len:379 (+),score=73.80 GHVS01094046.1:267-1403(+)